MTRKKKMNFGGLNSMLQTLSMFIPNILRSLFTFVYFCFQQQTLSYFSKDALRTLDLTLPTLEGRCQLTLLPSGQDNSEPQLTFQSSNSGKRGGYPQQELAWNSSLLGCIFFSALLSTSLYWFFPRSIFLFHLHMNPHLMVCF